MVLKESREYCNCRSITTATSADWREFADEMNRLCPLHGLRRLGHIVCVSGYADEGDPDDRRLTDLLQEYNRCIANTLNLTQSK